MKILKNKTKQKRKKVYTPVKLHPNGFDGFKHRRIEFRNQMLRLGERTDFSAINYS